MWEIGRYRGEEKVEAEMGVMLSQTKEARECQQPPCYLKDSLGASLVTQSVKNLPTMQETWILFLG